MFKTNYLGREQIMSKETVAEKMIHQLNYSFNLIRRERHSPEMRGGGVRRGQGQLLNVLLQKDVASQTELSELLQIRPASLGELVYKLERKGFIQRSPNAEDKRRVDVSLTAAGRVKALEIAASRQHLATELFAGLSDAEQEQFAALLDKFVVSLEAKLGNSDSPEAHRAGGNHHRQYGENYGDEGPRCKDFYEYGGDMGFGKQA